MHKLHKYEKHLYSFVQIYSRQGYVGKNRVSKGRLHGVKKLSENLGEIYYEDWK